MGYHGDHAKRQEIIKALQKEKKTLMNNLRETEVKDKEFVATKQRLRASLDQPLSSYRKLVKEVYILKDDRVETSDVYFER